MTPQKSVRPPQVDSFGHSRQQHGDCIVNEWDVPFDFMIPVNERAQTWSGRGYGQLDWWIKTTHVHVHTRTVDFPKGREEVLDFVHVVSGRHEGDEEIVGR